MRLPPPPALGAALALGAAAAHAQGARCDSVLAAPARDSVTHTVTISPAALDTTQGVPTFLLSLLGQGVAQAFVPPQPLAMPVHVVVPTPASMDPEGYPVISGEYVVAVRRDGSLGRAAILASSLDPAFGRAVLAAVARVDSIGYRFPLPDSTAGDSAIVRLRVDPFGTGPTSTPMFRARVPRRTFSEALVEGPPPAIPYTLDAIATGARGMVTTWFVVDTAGVPIARSVQVLRADHPQLLRMVLEALPTIRYRRTRVAGCAVPVHLVQRFDFAGYGGKGEVATVTLPGLKPAKSPPRRLDGTRPQLRYDDDQFRPTPAGRPEPVLTVELIVDERGNPEMPTLRVTGVAAAANRGTIEQWVSAGRWAPARDAAGNAIRGKWVLAVSLSTRVERVPPP